MSKIQPLTKEQLRQIKEAQVLIQQQQDYEKQQARLEAKSEREKFYRLCKKHFGMNYSEISALVDAEKRFHTAYNKSLVSVVNNKMNTEAQRN